MSKDSRALLNQLKATFDTVIAFAKAQESLYTTAQREVQEDKMRQQTIERRTLEVRSCGYRLLECLGDTKYVVCAGIVGNVRERGVRAAASKRSVRPGLTDRAPH